MKKFIVALLIALGIVSLVVALRFKAKSPTNSSSAADNSAAPSSTSSTPPTTAAATYKDGTYTGSAVDVGYGIVKVQATVSGGKLTDVTLIQMPAGGHSSEVSGFAGPQLKSEALQANSANVQIVSGATQTSEGFQQSLKAALQQAS